jgi:hypothetical protein
MQLLKQWDSYTAQPSNESVQSGSAEHEDRSVIFFRQSSRS